jgi:hypothetical protein
VGGLIDINRLNAARDTLAYMNPLTMALLRVAAALIGASIIVGIAHPGFWVGAAIIVVSFAATLVASLVQRPHKTGYR